MTIERYRHINKELMDMERKLNSYEQDMEGMSYAEGLCEAKRDTARQAIFDLRNHLCHHLQTGEKFIHVSEEDGK